MSIRFARSALFCPRDAEEFFDETLWEKYKTKQIDYDELCNAIRNKIYEKMKKEEMKELVNKWNPLIGSMLINADLRYCCKKNNDIIKAIFSYIYRSTYKAEYGNGYGYISHVSNSKFLCKKNNLLYRVSTYNTERNSYVNPSICYIDGILYFVAEDNGREHIRKVALKQNEYDDIVNDLKNIEQLSCENKTTYQKIGLLLKEKKYDAVFDIVNNSEIFFDTKKYLIALEHAEKMLNKVIVDFPCEKQKICDLILEDEQKSCDSIRLVKFVCDHYKEIVDIREERNWDMNPYQIIVDEDKKEFAPIEFYFKTFPSKTKYSGMIKIENVAPIKIFSSRMEGAFGEDVTINGNYYPIRYDPIKTTVYHTSRLLGSEKFSKLNINGNIGGKDIAIGDVILSIEGGKIITKYDDKNIVPIYLSTYNVGNSLLLVFLRMISYIQKEVYFPNYVCPTSKDVVCQREIIVDNIMLSAKKWSIPIKLLPICKGGLYTADEYNYIQKLVEKNGISRFVSVYSNGTNEKRVVDLYNPFSCIQLKKYYEDDYIFLEEITPPDSNDHMTQYLWESDNVMGEM